MSKTFILSDGTSRNSHGFAIDLSGMDLERFKKNPIMLYNHDREQPIGRWENVRVEDNRLMAEADIDTEDEVGKEVGRKVEKGYLKGCSVGIYIKKMTDDDDGAIATQTELLEASIVSIPSDADAICLYDENNKPTTIEQVRLSFNFNKNDMEQNTELTAAICTALGIEQGATAEAVKSAVQAKNDRIAELEAIVAAQQKAKVTELINRAVADKKIGADEKETYTALAEKDFDSVEKILSRMKGVTPLKAQLEQQGVASKYNGKTWDELDHAGMLAGLKAEAPEKYKELYEQKFNH